MQNLIHTKSCNHLKSETTNKLAYIYTNARILDQFGELDHFPESIKAKSVHNVTPEEEVTMENVLLGIEVDDNGAILDIGDAGDDSDTGYVDESDIDKEDRDES